MRCDATKLRRGGALLLEVCVSLAIIVSALGVLGAQLASGLRLTGTADQRTRAAALVDRLLTLLEFDPEWQDLILQDEEMEGNFGKQYPGWFWEIEFEPIEEVPGLGQVRVRVLYQDDPELREREDAGGARPVTEVALLKAERGVIDLVEDFGMTEEQVSELAEIVPMADFDPTALDPQVLVMLATEDPEVLLQLLPALMPLLQQYFGEALAAQGGLQGPGGLEERLREELGGAGEGVEEEGELEPEELLGGEESDESGGVPGLLPEEPGGGRRDRGARGGRRGAGRQGGQPRYTIEDLMRLRDELQRKGGG